MPTTIKHKRKAGAFVNGELAQAEWGLDITNSRWYYSADGTTVTAAPAALTPASSVVAETSFGQASAVGVSTNYARQDHTHGTPADPVTVAGVGSLVAGATSKATPVDADSLGLSDSAASGVLKKLTWANLKATLKTYFDTLYALLPAVTTTYTPTATPGSGAFTSVSAVGRHEKQGKRVFVRVEVTVTTVGTAGGYVDATLPFTATNNQYQVLAGVEVFNTGKALSAIILLNTATVRLRFYDNSSAIAAGNVLVCEGFYECQ